MKKMEQAIKGESLEEPTWGGPVRLQARPGLRSIKQSGWIFLLIPLI